MRSRRAGITRRLSRRDDISTRMQQPNPRDVTSAFLRKKKIWVRESNAENLPPLRCNTFNERSLDEFIISTLIRPRSHRPPLMLYDDQEALISLVHRATDLIAHHDRMFLYYPDSLILPMCRLYVVGSLDGDFDRLLTIFNQFSMPPFTTYIFLGDYLDLSGSDRADVLLLLLSLKLRFPRQIFLLRGHHETYEMCKVTRFDVFCRSKRLFNAFMLLFDYLPLVAVLGKFLCIHSGFSPFLTGPRCIMNFARPTEIKRMTIRERCLLTDILYGTPDLSLLPLFAPSFDYPIGFRFNTAALFTVLSMFDCEKLIRGCNARKSGTYFNFNSMYSLTIASGNSTDYNDRTVSGKYVVQIHASAAAFIKRIDVEKVWQILDYDNFVNVIISLLRNNPINYDMPLDCLICDWEAQGKKPENVTISHTELSDFSRTMIGERIDERYLLDPRIKQYFYCELFPFCIDHYYFGQHSTEVRTIIYEIYHNPFAVEVLESDEEIEPGQFNSLNRSYDRFINANEWDDDWPYPYTDQIVRPGYDLQKPELDESNDEINFSFHSLRTYDDQQNIQQRRRQSVRRAPNFRSYRQWLKSIKAPSLTYRYRVERPPSDDDDYDD